MKAIAYYTIDDLVCAKTICAEKSLFPESFQMWAKGVIRWFESLNALAHLWWSKRGRGTQFSHYSVVLRAVWQCIKRFRKSASELFTLLASEKQRLAGALLQRFGLFSPETINDEYRNVQRSRAGKYRKRDHTRRVSTFYQINTHQPRVQSKYTNVGRNVPKYGLMY